MAHVFLTENTMQCSGIWPAMALLLAALAGYGAHDDSKDKPGKPKPATTPEEAAQLMVMNMKAADFDALLSCIAEPARPAWQLMIYQMQIPEAFAKALDEKFGKDPKASPRETFKDRAKALKRIEVIGKEESKDKVDLTIRHVEEPTPGKERITYLKWRTVKEDSTWKILMPPHLSKKVKLTIKGKDGKEEVVNAFTFDEESAKSEMAWAKQASPKFKDAMGKVLKEVKDGKLATREEADKAYRAAERAFFEANPPPETKASREEK
jgi:hypothetical protein